MDPFEATMQSLLESVVDYIGSDHVQAVAITPDRATGTAHIEVALDDEDIALFRHALERLRDVREIFIDDVAFDYIITDHSLYDLIAEHQRDEALTLIPG